MRIVGGLEALPEAGAERAVVDGAADLEQPIGTAPRPAHLLRFVHATIDEEVGRSLGQRRANPQPGPVPFAVGLSRDWGSCRDGCWRMRIVGGLEAPAGHIAPSAHPQSLNTPAIGSSRKPSFDAGPADLSRLQRSKSSPLHKLVHLSLRYNPCSVWFLDRREMGGAGRLHARVHARPDRR